MTGRGPLAAMLWLSLLSGCAAVVRAVVASPARLTGRATPARTVRAEFERPRESGADSSPQLVVARDVFRLGRQPAATAYDPDRGVNPPAVAQEPGPALRLVGIVTGRQAAALIEGLPGTEGTRVVRAGEHVGKLTVTAIGHGRVLVAGPDTVWVLTVRRP